MYLNQNLNKEELAERISKLRQLMIKGGMALDRKGYSLLLEASVHLEDPKVRDFNMYATDTPTMNKSPNNKLCDLFRLDG